MNDLEELRNHIVEEFALIDQNMIRSALSNFYNSISNRRKCLV